MKTASAVAGMAAPTVSVSLRAMALPVLIVLMFGVFAWVEPDIFSLANVINILNQTAFLVIFALAQTLVLIPRGFDLSLGQAVSMVSVVTGLAMTGLAGAGVPMGGVVIAGVLAGLLAGLAVGLFNGVFSSLLGIRPFIVTLGSLNICQGLASTLSNGRPVFGIPDEFSSVLATGKIFGVQAAIIIAAAACFLVSFLLRKTVFGRVLYLIGGNARAAEVAGIPVKKYLLAAFCISSLLVALGSMILTARTGSGEPNLGGNLLLQAIAAAVMGGVSLTGGRGGVTQAIAGALAITVLSNGLNMMQVSGYLQQIILGAVIIMAVALDGGGRARR